NGDLRSETGKVCKKRVEKLGDDKSAAGGVGTDRGDSGSAEKGDEDVAKPDQFDPGLGDRFENVRAKTTWRGGERGADGRDGAGGGGRVDVPPRSRPRRVSSREDKGRLGSCHQ